MAERRAYRRGPAKPWSTRKVVMLKADRKKFDASPELSPFSALLQSREKKRKSAADSHCDGSYTDTVPVPSQSSLCEEEKFVESKEKSAEVEEDEKHGENKDTEADNAEEEGLKDAFDNKFSIKACSVVALTKLKYLNLSVIQEEEDVLPCDATTIMSSTPINRKSFAGGAGCPIIQSPLIDYLSPDVRASLTVREKILALSNQNDIIPIGDFFTPVMKRTLQKLGEGVFGEVFSCYTPEGDGLAVKIMPIEGKEMINDEKQKTFEEILPEMVISKELSDLGQSEDARYYTKNFVQLYKLGISKGKYPEFLINAWDNWDEREESDNDRPDTFNNKQLYVMFAFENSGCALEAFTFHNKREAMSVLAQIAATLAVGEAALKFEHRDMHRGNILVRRTKEEKMVFVIDSHKYVLPSEGVHVTVIDYTLSRLSQGSCTSYNDLNNLPWLFKGHGGIQHETYLRMQNATKNDWSKFAPKTNACWLHYIVNKMAIKSRVKYVTRAQIQAAFEPLVNQFLNYDSAKDIFLEYFSNPSPLSFESKKLKRK